MNEDFEKEKMSLLDQIEELKLELSAFQHHAGNAGGADVDDDTNSVELMIDNLDERGRHMREERKLQQQFNQEKAQIEKQYESKISELRKSSLSTETELLNAQER